MKSLLLSLLLLVNIKLVAQNSELSPFNGSHWGVVLEHPDMKNVVVKKDVVYLKDDKDTLHIDLYFPPGLKKGVKVPAIVFLNGIGDSDGDDKLKSSGIYTTWPKLIAAHGYVGISMESDGERIHENFDALFKYLHNHGEALNVDATRLGVYAASANGRESAKYLMNSSAFPGIKAAVFYYGEVPRGPYRKDLPVLFVVAERDIRGDSYSQLWAEVLKNKSPWTIKLASGLPHAFDAFSENDDSKKIILETISFWKNNLDPVPASSYPPSKTRAIVAAQYEDDEKLVTLMREWFKENPKTQDGAAFSLYAGALMRTKQFADAETYLKKSIALNPERKGHYLSMTVVAYALDKPADAEKYLAKYEEGTKPEGFTYGYIANNLIGLKKYEIAKKYYEKTITFTPRASDYYNLACCYAVAGETDNAFINLAKAVENGIANKAGYEADEDLKTLKTDPRWQELMKKLQ